MRANKISRDLLGRVIALDILGGGYLLLFFRGRYGAFSPV